MFGFQCVPLNGEGSHNRFNTILFSQLNIAFAICIDFCNEVGNLDDEIERLLAYRIGWFIVQR